MNADDPRHGTNAGYQAHHKWGVPVCDPCRSAHAAQHRQFLNRRYLQRLPTLLVDPTPTVRRIRALQAIGWPLGEIDAALGRTGKSSSIWKMLQQPSIHVDTAAKVAAIYDRLHMTPGPSERTRAIAARQGWIPPLGWDDIDVDERPADGQLGHVDPVVVDRILAGDMTLARSATKAERVEVVGRWSGSLAQLSRQSGWRVDRYRSESAA